MIRALLLVFLVACTSQAASLVDEAEAGSSWQLTFAPPIQIWAYTGACPVLAPERFTFPTGTMADCPVGAKCTLEFWYDDSDTTYADYRQTFAPDQVDCQFITMDFPNGRAAEPFRCIWGLPPTQDLIADRCSYDTTLVEVF